MQKSKIFLEIFKKGPTSSATQKTATQVIFKKDPLTSAKTTHL